MKLSLLIEDAQKILDHLGDLEVFFPGDYGLEPVKNILAIDASSEDENEKDEVVAIIQLEHGDDE